MDNTTFMRRAIELSRSSKNRPGTRPYGAVRWCQTNANQSQFARKRRISGRAELAPLGESGGAVELKI
jgi:hypothetical protein